MLGRRMRYIRKMNGDTIAELASILKCSPTSLSGWEHSRNDVPADIVKAFCKHYDISADYMLGLIDIDPLFEKASKAFTEDEMNELRKFIEYINWKRENVKRKGGHR